MKYFLLILIFISCNPIQRHARIVEKFPYVHTIDSIKLIDTIRLNTYKVISDTVVHEKHLIDTIILNKDNLTVRVLRFRDSVYINGECDTIFIEKVIVRNIPVKYYKEKVFKWNFVFILIVSVLAFIFIARIIFYT
tara:strand:- start:2428 stop:2835 length:408 start_codon:yes stop_codon:yes gene_type:complete